MKTKLILTALMAVLAGTLAAAAFSGTAVAQPPFAADRIKIQLTAEAEALAELPQGLYATTDRFGLKELDQLVSLNGATKLIRAHRQVKDAAWAQSNGWNRWFLIQLDGSVGVQDALKSFQSSRYIETATPEFIAYTTVVPNDTYFANNWGHNNTAQLPVYQSGGHTGAGVGTVGFDSDAQLAWDQSQGYGSASIVIAVIDTGVDTAHPDLRLVTGYDYGDNDSNPMDNSAEAGHGTSCSGVAAGKASNNLGVTGSAGGCSVMPLKVANSAGDMYFTAIENALTHAADYNAHIVSMSLGAESGMGEGDSPSTDAALTYAYNAGVAIFAATANSNASTIAYPANHTAVISVGAASPCGQRKSTTSCDGEYWWGSNYGTSVQDAKEAVDIMAPTILPATDITGSGGYSTTDYYMWFNGTSCATPYAAGVGALVLSRDPGLSPAQLRSILTSSATDMTIDGGAGWDRYTGYGMVNANNALAIFNAYNPPRNLTATPGNSFVILNWQTPAYGTPTGYKIFKDSILLTTVSAATLSYTDYDVLNETIYSYYLTAVYTEGESDPTPPVIVTPSAVAYVILGTGSSTTNNNQLSPINNTFKSIHGQSVYTAAELAAAGISGPALITRLGFYPVSQPNLALVNFVVRMKHTDLSNAAEWIPGTDLVTVYSSPAYMPVTGDYDLLTLDPPFLWNGIDNLVLDTAFGLLANYSQSGTLRYTTVTNGYRRVASDTVNQTNIFSDGAVRNFRPNVKLALQILPPEPQIEVQPQSLNFGQILVDTPSTSQFTLSNTGSAFLNGSISTPAGYSVASPGRTFEGIESLNEASPGRNTLGFNIAPGASAGFTLTFLPPSPGNYDGNIQIASNDPNTPLATIAVTGSGYLPPTLTLDQDSLAVTLLTGETTAQQLLIGNSGSQNLTWISSEVPAAAWFAAAPSSGNIAGGGSQSLTCSFSAVGLAPGSYATLLQIVSNDPYYPLYQIPVQMNVLVSELAPPLLDGIQLESGSMTLNWQPVPYALAYKIYRAWEPAGEYVLQGTTDQTSWEDPDGLPQAFYRVIASSDPLAE